MHYYRETQKDEQKQTVTSDSPIKDILGLY